ncbi:PspC domain-containing protein [Planctobacterium marinum]|uniref:PspC domain-containing protein n=1 Tax=Planctobacterium marinum TaxID=1631968 RepID=UPI001E3BB98A|nr:PspC domain-containing protein [Planctobacterium marinum]MCC2607896.1 PspC domain-containing protein [Planctobacterium marinum]
MKNYYESNRIYKSRINRKVMGVCAGVAHHYGVEAWMVRLATVLAFLAFPPAILIAYIVATLLLPSR